MRSGTFSYVIYLALINKWNTLIIEEYKYVLVRA